MAQFRNSAVLNSVNYTCHLYPQTFVADLARQYGSLSYHKEKETSFSHSIELGCYPSITLPIFNSDLTKGLSHYLAVQYHHEAVDMLSRKVCEIMRDHHKILNQEESLGIETVTENLKTI